VSSLPGWAQIVARFLPASYIFEGMRKTIGQAQIPWENLAISFGLNFVYLILSFLVFRSCFRKSQQLGLARLE
jgi:ABC-2 type transport system permease protein